MPFLYPIAFNTRLSALQLLVRSSNTYIDRRVARWNGSRRPLHLTARRQYSSSADTDFPPLPDLISARTLNPTPSDYSQSLFADTAEITVVAGSGGNGCVSFLREKFIAEGPANGGDGGTGGNVYMSAVPELKSLHKLTRRREVRAANGKHGMGKSRGGQRGEDVVIEVPVGTTVREISRWDPIDEAEKEYEDEEAQLAYAKYRAKKEEKRRRYEEAAAKGDEQVEAQNSFSDGTDVAESSGRSKDTREASTHWGDEESADYQYHYRKKKSRPDMIGFGADADYQRDENGEIIHKRPEFDGDQRGRWRRDRWLLQPSSLPSEYVTTNFPALPRPRRSNVAAAQPPAPIHLDLSRATSSPVLLAAGAAGGLGNPHFVTKTIHRPKFATKGNVGMRIKLQLELKLLADLGFVGMPNAGKSTLLRALSNSRARVGNWAFTTLTPNLGTIILDDHRGRARLEARDGQGKRLSGITVADIPGLIVGASEDRGLGLAFLRHVERAKVLAFVIDLAAGDAVETLRALWNELGLYEMIRKRERQEHQQQWKLQQDRGVIQWDVPLIDRLPKGTRADHSRTALTQDSMAAPAASRPGIGNTESGSVLWRASFSDSSSTSVASINTVSQDIERIDDARQFRHHEEPQQEQLQQQHGHHQVFDQSSAQSPLSPPLPLALPISAKPWFVIATKADLGPATQDNFTRLQQYLAALAAGQTDQSVASASPLAPSAVPVAQEQQREKQYEHEHDQNEQQGSSISHNRDGLLSCQTKAERQQPITAIPVSAIHGHGIDKIIETTASLLAR